MILEGIHALNPAVVTEANSHIVRIYVSVRTRITDGTSVLQPYFLRLLRRMIRDRLFRHRSLSATLEMLEHVEAGEQHYIMPYKKYADLEVDSFHAYELGIFCSWMPVRNKKRCVHSCNKQLPFQWSRYQRSRWCGNLSEMEYLPIEDASYFASCASAKQSVIFLYKRKKLWYNTSSF